jgi:thiamine biosynthesis lipoprotein
VSPETPRRTWVQQVMGMPVSVLARGPRLHAADVEDAVRRLYDELLEVDAVFSTYKEQSAVSRIRRGELTVRECPADVGLVVERCAWAREVTGGLFDADHPDGSWDPSGLVKGWAAERAFEHLVEVSELDWCLNTGGDVVVRSVSGEPFVVGIQDPRDPSRVCAAVPLTSGAVATSGTAARGAHIYDPRSGATAHSATASVSVHGPSLETADVLATAAFVADDAWESLVTSVPGYSALRVDERGALTATLTWPGLTEIPTPA